MGSRNPSVEAPLLVDIGDGTSISVHPFPDDPRFVGDVRRALSSLAHVTGCDESVLLRGARETLRRWYPYLEIHARDPLGSLVQGDRVWYVMRDGTVRAPREVVDRMQGIFAEARQTVEASNRAMARSRAVVELAARPRGRPSRPSEPENGE